MDEKALDNPREEIRQGRLDAEHLLSVIGSLNRRLLAALQRIEELEREKGGSGKVEQPFSVREEEKRQEARGRTRKRKRPGRGVRCGRLRTADKIALAQRTEQVFLFQELLNQLTGRHGGDSDRASRKSVLDERLPVPAG
ncbi:hypothetical protein FJY94_08950 [Candidatus Kaiserbacteria bacterium]|nr:hypothetical protein [Candidatus Kaiserbacteria bacterium]